MIHYETQPSPFRARRGKHLNFIPHMHQEMELVYIHSGSMTVTIQQIPYTVYPSDFILIMPHTLHEYQTPDICEHTMLIFKPDIIAHYQPLMTKQCLSPVIPGKYLHSDIPFYLEQFFIPETREDMGLLKGYLYLLFARLIPQLTFEKNTHSTSHQDLIYHCLEYIHLHFKESITLQDLASHTGVSCYYISRLFNQSIGYSLTHYLNTLRIDYAKHLLRESAFSITQIALECGYETIRHFNRVFKTFTGISPHEYQKKISL